VMVRNDVPEKVWKQVQKCLIGLNQTKEGKAILVNIQTARFTVATNKDYDIVKIYTDRFEREVRKIELK
jgi:ABC-type phosphate/phosphonate transport system substrate-binding protein